MHESVCDLDGGGEGSEGWKVVGRWAVHNIYSRVTGASFGGNKLILYFKTLNLSTNAKDTRTGFSVVVQFGTRNFIPLIGGLFFGYFGNGGGTKRICSEQEWVGNF